MRSSKSVISAMLGIAFLAMPITAAARSNRNQGRANFAPGAFHPAPARAFRPAPAPRFNPPARSFARPMPNFRAANDVRFHPAPMPNRWKPALRQNVMTPRPFAPARWNNVPPPADRGWDPPRPRHDYMWNRYNREPDRDDFRTVCDDDGDNCRQVPYEYGYGRRTPYYRPAPAYGPSYAPDYGDCDDGYDGGYEAEPQSYSSPMPNEGLLAYRARLQALRAHAVMNYRFALSRHNRNVANANKALIRHLDSRLSVINRQIAAQGYGNGYAGAYANPYTNGYGQYGYGTGGMYSSLAPMLSNFIP